jgi:hypothetical protein
MQTAQDLGTILAIKLLADAGCVRVAQIVWASGKSQASR